MKQSAFTMREFYAIRNGPGLRNAHWRVFAGTRIGRLSECVVGEIGMLVLPQCVRYALQAELGLSQLFRSQLRLSRACFALVAHWIQRSIEHRSTPEQTVIASP